MNSQITDFAYIYPQQVTAEEAMFLFRTTQF
jgi:hypothetical protein